MTKKFEKIYRISQKMSMCFVSVLIMVLVLSGLSYATEITIGIIPERDVFKQVESYRSLGKYIENKSGIKIRYTILSKSGNIIERFKQKKLDGAFWGSMTGAMAIRQLDMQPIARQVDLDNVSTHQGYIFVHKYSVIDSVERMKDVEIAVVDRATTTGYLFPLAYLREGGVENIDGHFTKYYFTGSHKDAINAVLDRRVDIGCADNTVFELLSLENPRIKEDLMIIAKSPNVLSTSLGLKKEVPLALREELKQILLDMNNNSDGREILSRFGAEKFIETTESDYASVFDIADRAGLDLRNYEYKNK